jgi:hypothetical protein
MKSQLAIAIASLGVLTPAASHAAASACRYGIGKPVHAKFRIRFASQGQGHTVSHDLRTFFPASARRANGGKRLVAQLPIIPTRVAKSPTMKFNFIPTLILDNPDSASCSMQALAGFNDRRGFAEAKTQFQIEATITVGGATQHQTMSAYTSCFEENTRIALADGSSALVRELVPGDVVRNPVTGAAVKVKHVIRGEELSGHLVELGLPGGERLLVTAAHPIPTARGVVRARDVTAGDRLLGGGGANHALYHRALVPVDRLRHVYNLVLDTSSTREKDHFVLANGIVAGDQFLQDRLQGAR